MSIQLLAQSQILEILIAFFFGLGLHEEKKGSHGSYQKTG